MSPADQGIVASEAAFEKQRIHRYLFITVVTRFLAIAGVLVALLMPGMFVENRTIAGVIAAIALIANFAYFLFGFRKWPSGAFHSSGLVDIGVLGALIAVTGGTASPFIALFSLVIVFNAVFYGWVGVLSGTLPSIVALWIGALVAGVADPRFISVTVGVWGALAFLSGIVGEGERRHQKELRGRARAFGAVSETSTTIGSYLEAEALLTTAAGRAHQLAEEFWGEGTIVVITLLDSELKAVRLARVAGTQQPEEVELPLESFSSVLRLLMEKKEPYFLDSERKEHFQAMIAGAARKAVSVYVVPIVIGNQGVGALSVHCPQPIEHEDPRLEFIGTIGNNIASALSRIQALDAERHHRHQATQLFELARDLNAVSDLDEILHRVSGAGLELAEVDACVVGLISEDGKMILPRAWASRGEAPTPQKIAEEVGDIPVEELREALADRQPMIIEDVARTSEIKQKFAMLFGVRSGVVFPILIHGEPVGAVGFGYQEVSRPISISQLQLGEAISGLASVAIQNARLLEAERKRVAQLTELDRMKSEFVSTASHELRSPLTSITGYARTLLRPGANFTDEERQGFVQIIDDQARQLSRLVDELLTVSRIEQGGLRLAYHALDISAMVKGLFDAVSPRTKRHTFASDFDEEFPPVVADESKMLQVLSNLLDNAVKYSPEGGRIEFGGCHRGDQVELWVSDEGVGLSSQELKGIFEKFYQVEGRPKASGAGLGLYIVRQLVEAHGGRIWAESNEARGTTFRIMLPQRRAVDQAAAAGTEAAPRRR